MQVLPTKEDLDWIVAFALEQNTVDDVLDIMEICCEYGCIITVPPMEWEGWESDDEKFEEGGEGWPSHVLNVKEHLGPIYRHAIRLIETQEEALLICKKGLLHGIPTNEYLAAFFIALEFCDSLTNLMQITNDLIDCLDEYSDGIFSIEEELKAIFDKKKELIRLN